ncbi:MAG: PASTA domain-containing protein, partial [Bacilli bacterium]|nr:PASTA domain-containing protein [Bacilli bacterium]
SYPNSGSTILKDDKIFLMTNGNSWIMENLTGWSRIDATNYLKLVGLNVKTTGYGYVSEQSIIPGTPIISGTEIMLTLVDKYNFDVKEVVEDTG